MCPLEQAQGQAQIPIHPGSDGHGASRIVKALTAVPIKHFCIGLVPIARQACRNKISGRVDLSIVIDDTGRVTDYSLKRSTHQDLTREVMRVIKKWKFSPAIKDGRPVTVRKIQPFLFGQQ